MGLISEAFLLAKVIHNITPVNIIYKKLSPTHFTCQPSLLKTAAESKLQGTASCKFLNKRKVKALHWVTFKIYT